MEYDARSNEVQNERNCATKGAVVKCNDDDDGENEIRTAYIIESMTGFSRDVAKPVGKYPCEK